MTRKYKLMNKSRLLWKSRFFILEKSVMDLRITMLY